MSNFKVISDSACDLSPELAKEKNIELVPFYVSFDDDNYLKEGVDISNQEFFHRLETHNLLPKTSLPSVQDYINIYKPHLEQGHDILSLCISSSLSGSYQSATNAANMLLEEFPDRKISVIDSKQATLGQALIVKEIIKMRDADYTLDKTTEMVNKIRETACIIFTVDTLEYLKKGGRIGKAAAIAGGLLNIKPNLIFRNGELKPLSKNRGKRKAIESTINSFLELLEEDKSKYEFIVGHIRTPEEATGLKNVLVEKHGLNITHPIIDIGIVIGAHIGPGGVGVAFMEKVPELS